jgi:hypothetical protein
MLLQLTRDVTMQMLRITATRRLVFTIPDNIVNIGDPSIRFDYMKVNYNCT